MGPKYLSELTLSLLMNGLCFGGLCVECTHLSHSYVLAFCPVCVPPSLLCLSRLRFQAIRKLFAFSWPDSSPSVLSQQAASLENLFWPSLDL